MTTPNIENDHILIAPTTEAATSNPVRLRGVLHGPGSYPVTFKAIGAGAAQTTLLATDEAVTLEYWDGYKWWTAKEYGADMVLLNADNNIKSMYVPTYFRVNKSATANPVGVLID